MIPPAQSGPVATRFLCLSAAGLLAGYLILGWIGSSCGISSLDANGIIHVVNDRLRTGSVEISRPPGHPLSEYWMLPNLVRIMPTAHILSPFAYGLYQMMGGLFSLVLFWLLLREVPISPTRRLLAVACLAFSPQFLITSSDGEEFLWGMGFVFIAVLIVSRLSRGAMKHPFTAWCTAVVCAVAASGYRIEYGAVALLVVFGTLLFSDQSWPRKFSLGGLALVLLAILWTPVLIHQGMAPPYPNPLSLKTRLAIGIYKIVFHASGLLPILIASAFVFQARGSIRLLPPFGGNILSYWSLGLAVIFFCLFFVYPTKILEVLPGMAFLIWLGAVHAGRWTWACFVAACISLPLIHLDCFRDRQWTGVKPQPSLWTQSLAEKPALLRPELDAASRLAETGPHVVITSIWPWSMAWQKEHAAWPGLPEPKRESLDFAEAYSVGPGIVASRNILDNDTADLKSYIQKGYEIWIDKKLYREMYMRYDLSAPTPQTAVVEGIPCRVVEVK
jgi:hypothetical protein